MRHTAINEQIVVTTGSRSDTGLSLRAAESARHGRQKLTSAHAELDRLIALAPVAITVSACEVQS